MDTHTQLDKLNKEIDATVILIAKKEEKRDKTSDGTEKAIILDSAIKVLYSDRSVLIADRSRLLAAAAPAPGKNTPLAVDASVPPLYAKHTTPPARCRVP